MAAVYQQRALSTSFGVPSRCQAESMPIWLMASMLCGWQPQALLHLAANIWQQT